MHIIKSPFILRCPQLYFNFYAAEMYIRGLAQQDLKHN